VTVVKTIELNGSTCADHRNNVLLESICERMLIKGRSIASELLSSSSFFSSLWSSSVKRYFIKITMKSIRWHLRERWAQVERWIRLKTDSHCIFNLPLWF